MASNALPAKITVTGDLVNSGNKPIDAVGFFRDKTQYPAPTMAVASGTDLVGLTDTSVDVILPAAVKAGEAGWLVRVREGTKWSDVNTSATFTVGQAAPASCPAASNGGNFGQLDFGDQNNPNADITQVFKTGPAKNVVAYDGPASPALCNGLPLPALIYDGVVDNANCVSTEPGFKPGAATAGLLSDTDSRLRVDTTCGTDGRVTVGDWHVNDDYLSCFLTDSSVTLGDIESPSYSGDPVLSPDIVRSPRFFFVPVFAADPSDGTKAYKVIAFRPAFLTDQPASATSMTALPPASTQPAESNNGITIGSNGKIQSLNFILFSEKALPNYLDSGLPTSPTYVFGPKIVKLID